MKETFEDITSRILEEPSWYDENGTPRYGMFAPSRCPDIYARVVVLLEIACQNCGKAFQVEMNVGYFDRFKQNHPPKFWHYGDPPAHNCVGDSMNCIDVKVLECWRHGDIMENEPEWIRMPEAEVACEDWIEHRIKGNRKKRKDALHPPKESE